MRYKRAVFVAGAAVGFIAGSRAGRKPYDEMVRYTRKALQSPPAQRVLKARLVRRASAAFRELQAFRVLKARGAFRAFQVTPALKGSRETKAIPVLWVLPTGVPITPRRITA